MEAGEILLTKGLLDERQLQLARKCADRGHAARSGGRPTWDSSPKRRRSAALGEEVGLEFVDLVEAEIDLSLLQRLPLEVHPPRGALSRSAARNGTLVVATSDPFNLYPLDELSVGHGSDGRARAGQPRGNRQADQDPPGRGQRDDRRADGPERRRRHRAARGDRGRRLRSFRDGPGAVGRPAGQRDPAGGDRAAGQRRAHRVAGSRACGSATASTACCTPQPMPPEINRFQAAIISRLKIMARLNIAEQRLPQDGRIQLRGRRPRGRRPRVGHPHDPRRRASCCGCWTRARMEFIARQASAWRTTSTPRSSELIRLPHGIILVTGPTGSGKTHHALQRPAGDQERRDQDHHHRRPGRVPAGRHQPDPGASEDRPDVRASRCGASCGTTPTSSWSAKSATWKRPRTPSRRR